jgi:hypothetical protein
LTKKEFTWLDCSNSLLLLTNIFFCSYLFFQLESELPVLAETLEGKARNLKSHPAENASLFALFRMFVDRFQLSGRANVRRVRGIHRFLWKKFCFKLVCNWSFNFNLSMPKSSIIGFLMVFLFYNSWFSFITITHSKTCLSLSF